MQKVIVSQQTKAGMGDFLTSINLIEALLSTIRLSPTALRSHLPLVTGHLGIDDFLGFSSTYGEVLSSVHPSEINHDCLSVDELFSICRGLTEAPSGSTIEIAWTADDYKSLESYRSFLADNRIDLMTTPIRKAALSSRARHMASKLKAYLESHDLMCVLCHVRRGDISFVPTGILQPYLREIQTNPFYYVLESDFVPLPFSASHQGYRYVQIQKFEDALDALLGEYDRSKLFVVCSSDGYSKFLTSLANSDYMARPFDKHLLNTISREFSYVSERSDLFLAGDSPFDLEQSIIFSAIADVVITSA
jgi:hypothetical protein